MAPSWPAAWRRYSLAVLAAAVAALAKLAFGVGVLPGTYGAFAPAVLVSAWYGGLGPGLLAAGLSTLLAVAINGPADALSSSFALRTFLFVAIAAVASWIFEKRALAVARLAENEERLRRMVESDMIGIIFWQRNGGILDANERFLRMVGYSRDDLRSGRVRWDDLTPPEYAPSDREALASIDATGTWAPFEKEYICKDGSRIPILIAGAATNEARDRGVSLILEISERKRSERALQAANLDLEQRVRARTQELWQANALLEQELVERQRVETALRASVERSRGISALSFDYTYAFRVDENYRVAFEWTAGAFERITGIDPKQVARVSGILDIVHPDDHAALADRLRRLLLGESVVTEYRVRTRDGRHRWLQEYARPEWNEAHTRVVHVLGAGRDITDQREAEEALRASEQRFARAVAGANDGIWDLNLETGEIYLSPRWKAILGLADDEIGNNPEEWMARVHPDDVERVLGDIAAHLSGETTLFRSEYRLRHHDGHYLWVLVRAVAVRNPDGSPHLMAGSLTDLTPRKRAEEEARRRQAELAHAQRLSTMGEMAAGLAHEMNQPLAAIVSYARGCERRIASGDARSDELLYAINQVAAQALRAGEIIRRYRSFVSIGSDRREAVNLNALAQEVALLVKPSADEEQVAIRLDLDPNLPAIHADGLQIEQVLLNLIRNGLDAMHAVEHRRLVIATRAIEEGVEVTVRDSGRGFSPEVADRIFDAFFTTKAEGLGMGLSISRSIIDAHGGRLSFDSSGESGTTFRFVLPIDATEE